MRSRIAALVILMTSTICTCTISMAAELLTNMYPHLNINTDLILVTVFVPDMEYGFYRSTRFEWSGIIWQLTANGHTYFTQRKSPHDPLNPGHGMSLAEEFSIGTSLKSPQRFDEVVPGETFMKIGVGTLIKPEDNPEYSFQTTYEFADKGLWTWMHGKDWISFTHILADTSGLAYAYTKRLELVPGTTALRIRHWLTNTGTAPLAADQYNHNFFTIDNEPIGPGYEIELFFDGNTSSNWEPVATLQDNRITIEKPVSDALFGVFSGLTGAITENRVIITHTKTGAGVDISGDFPLSGFNFYASSICVCPELFILLELEPGETKQWTRSYRFFTDNE